MAKKFCGSLWKTGHAALASAIAFSLTTLQVAWSQCTAIISSNPKKCLWIRVVKQENEKVAVGTNYLLTS